MEALPDNLRFIEILNGKDVVVETENDLSLFDTAFPFGIPPVVPDVKTELENIIDDISENLPLHSLQNTQQIFTAPPKVSSLYSYDMSPCPSELRIVRDLATGTLEGYYEVFHEIKKGNEDVAVDFEKNFETIPPGFEEGMTFSNLAPEALGDGENSVRHVLALTELVAASADLSEAGEVPRRKEAKAVSSEVVDDVDLMKQLPSEPVTAVLNISMIPTETQKSLEWAEVVDVRSPMTDFHERIPDMAFTWPFELDTFQKQAILHLEKRDSVFVAAHTSAGKTVVAEYAIALSRQHMTKTIYTSPIKALSNEKYRDFKDTFEDIGIITGDVQINKEASCLIMTTEILRSMLYNKSSVVNDLEWVIFDECHYINDPERGVVWEEVLIMLPKHVGLVLLSATVPNAMDLANWIGRIKQRKLYVICTTKRPVPLEHHLYFNQETFMILDPNSNFITSSYMKASERRRQTSKGGRFQDEKNLYVGLIQHLKKMDRLPVICFTLSRKRCDENAAMLRSQDLTTAEEKSEIHRFLHHCVSRLSKSDQKLPQIRTMRLLLECGFGVHHSGVLPIMKEAVEMLFQRGLVRVLFATETFAMGVNVPARTVVFDSIRKHDGITMRDLLPAEYIQMAGRAGRRGKDKTGNVLIICKGDVPESSQLATMMLGRPTELQSKFRVTYSMILNLKAEAQRRVEDMMKDSFRENTQQSQSDTLEEKRKDLAEELQGLTRTGCSACTDLPLDLLAEHKATRSSVWERLLVSPQANKVLSPGRLVVVCPESQGNRNILGAVSSVSPREKKLSLLVLVPSQSSASREPLPWPLNKRLVLPEGAIAVQALTVSFAEVLCVSSLVQKFDARKVMQPQGKNILGQELLEVAEAHTKGIPSINIIKDLRVSDIDSVALVHRFLGLEEKIFAAPCLSCPLFEEHYVQELHHKAVTQELLRIEHLLSEASLASMPDYKRHVEALERLGYVEPSGPLTLKGRVARAMSNNAIMLTELLVEDCLVNLGAADIAALFSCFVFQQRTDELPMIPKSMVNAVELFKSVAKRIGQAQRDSGFEEPPEQFVEQFSFGMCNVVYHWAKGMHFAHIMELTDIQEGIIVRCIQRLDEVLKDVRTAAGIIGNPELRSKMEESSRLIRKDIVFAASLYLQ
ncbi:superkiller complex protein 2-like [Ornithodoros turicata]|uniref:superkiller complex protein 2-like n=1 Tax=Ornithodoros turicata TaxID=34597 RepID=UPI0031397C6B